MEAKTWQDTVMTGKQIDSEMDRIEKLDTSYTTAELELCRTQAEISFKAGEQVGIQKGVHSITQSVLNNTLHKSEEMKAYLEELKQEGIREVVEWIKSNANLERGDRDVGLCFEDYLHFDYHNWQAKLKDWGIEWNVG